MYQDQVSRAMIRIKVILVEKSCALCWYFSNSQFSADRGCIGEPPPLYPLEKVSFRFTPTTDTKQFEVPSDLDCGFG
jgi:hypothetical protein